MTIHSEHPFRDPEPGPGTPLPRSGGGHGEFVDRWERAPERAGLTVTSFLMAAGEEARVLALLDPDADLTERLLGSGRGVVRSC